MLDWWMDVLIHEGHEGCFLIHEGHEAHKTRNHEAREAREGSRTIGDRLVAMGFEFLLSAF
ncbi:hypothetical protein SE18_15240 [Herpetosiphon geysericola]|uniref:Uncharacterized protein n=1 Tax=Herpetosiphon geysericola TaxID=70996 RepID=A0A0P6YSA9_9CHLR|nr:hypothetical protein SE18_15240 [Herpetosiphon geysericola]